MLQSLKEPEICLIFKLHKLGWLNFHYTVLHVLPFVEKKAHFVIRKKKFHFPRASRWMGKRMKLLTGQIFSVSKGGIKWRYVFKKVSWVIFFFQREIRFYKTTKKTTKKFVAKLDIYHFWSLCCKLWRALQKNTVSPYLESACQMPSSAHIRVSNVCFASDQENL